MRFSLLNLLIAVSLAAIFLGGRAMISGITGAQILSSVMGGLVAVWAALWFRGTVRILAAGAIAGAMASTLTALILGIEIAEHLRRTAGYFNWRQDWLLFALMILRPTIDGVLLGLGAGLGVAAYRAVVRG